MSVVRQDSNFELAMEHVEKLERDLASARQECKELGAIILKQNRAIAELEAKLSIVPEALCKSTQPDDPFCWYIVRRDITDEYTTVYSEEENCPGPGWKPLYAEPQPRTPQNPDEAQRAEGSPQHGEPNGTTPEGRQLAADSSTVGSAPSPQQEKP
jgi:hypothetical protein